MTGWFFFMLWLGGISPAYERERQAGRGVGASLFNAVAWVLNVGHKLCKTLYISDRERGW